MLIDCGIALKDYCHMLIDCGTALKDCCYVNRLWDCPKRLWD